MRWNHRAMRTVHDNGEVAYSIREVFYDDDGTIEGWTAEPMDPHGETLDELRADLVRMLACLGKPVMDEAEELAKCERRLLDEAYHDDCG